MASSMTTTPSRSSPQPSSKRSSPQPIKMSSGLLSPLKIGRSSPCRDESPVVAKRRKMEGDSPYSISPCESPVPTSQTLTEVGTKLASYAGSRLGVFNNGYDEWNDSSNYASSSGASANASPTPLQQSRRSRSGNTPKTKQDLWASIESDYQYLMDDGIIEQCKSTESDLSWESDDLASNTKVSFAEFMQQYRELDEWLGHMQTVVQRQASSLSEKYLNQTYHEDMLQRSPRRKLFNDYAKQLMRRYPSMKEEICQRLQHLNNQWQVLENTVTPTMGLQDHETMMKDLEEDLGGLSRWLHEVETKLQCRVDPKWSPQDLQTKLTQHQVLQRDIESHSKIVSAVLKLCDRVQGERRETTSQAVTLRLEALNLERRWHGVWLQSLEWQCLLEETLARGHKGVRGLDGSYLDWNEDSFSSPNVKGINITDGSYDFGSDGQDYEDEILDSDNSWPDILPFSESEYEKIPVDTESECEKIVVDTDTQTDDIEDRNSSPDAVSGRTKAGKCNSDPGIDSALGRSISDPSVTDHYPSVCHAARKLTTAQVDQAVQKALSSMSQRSLEMRMAPDPEVSSSAEDREPVLAAQAAAGAPVMIPVKPENPDVGYSSESYTEESDQIVPLRSRIGTNNEYKYEPVLRRHYLEEAGACSDIPQSFDNFAQSYLPVSSWRHSMTSAYDTSSSCSDHCTQQEQDLSDNQQEVNKSFSTDDSTYSNISRKFHNKWHSKVKALTSTPKKKKVPTATLR